MHQSCADGYLRPCYFTNWAQYRTGAAKFLPEDYVPGLCTHILYAFGWMNEDYTAKAYDETDLPNSWKPGGGLYARVNALKHFDPALKTLLSFGGWSFGTRLFKEMTSTARNRKVFITSAITFARQYGFDGVDIDWEYPSGDLDRENLNHFLQEFLDAAIAEGRKSGRPRLLVTAAVAAGTENINNGYDIPVISRLLDFVLLMSYDFHGAWETVTGLNAPLYAQSNETPDKRLWNVAGAANYWVEKGMPKNKLVIGIPTYGRGWTLANKEQHGIGALAPSPSHSTKYIQTSGTAAYYEFCEMLANGAHKYIDDSTRSPYLIYKKDQWFSYEDEESITLKVKWIKSNGFAGAFVWTLDFDDFAGQCSTNYGRKYPLIGIIARELGGVEVSNGFKIPTPGSSVNVIDTNTPISSTIKPKPANISPPINSFGSLIPDAFNLFCYGKRDGFLEWPGKTRRTTIDSDGTTSTTLINSVPEDFLLCLRNKAYRMKCPDGLQFSMSTGFCTFSKNELGADGIRPHRTTVPFGSGSSVSGINNHSKPGKTAVVLTLQSSASEKLSPDQPTVGAKKTEEGVDEFICDSDGFFADPHSCFNFYRCVGRMRFRFDCPRGTVWNRQKAMCDFPPSMKRNDGISDEGGFTCDDYDI